MGVSKLLGGFFGGLLLAALLAAAYTEGLQQTCELKFEGQQVEINVYKEINKTLIGKIERKSE
jgi:hypothetical protein